MRTITNQDLIDANRAAYKAQRLIAQNLDLLPQGRDPCVYQGPYNTNCAIGAALTDAELATVAEQGLNESTSADELAGHGVVAFADITFAIQLQTTHDNWATGNGEIDPENEDSYLDPHQTYRTLIGL